MPFGPTRKSTRAPGFDYRDPGPYLVTVCTQHRVHRFGPVEDGSLTLNPAGVMVWEAWTRCGDRFPGTILDEFVVMPNHLHALLTLAIPNGPSLDGMSSLTDIVAWFKTQSTRRYIEGVKRHGWPPFEGQLWQRSFHDEIVRTERGMERLREYILDNPRKWADDEFNRPQPTQGQARIG